MMIIKDVEVLETNKDICEVMHAFGNPQQFYEFDNQKVEEMEVVQELVREHRFTHPNGTEVIIGMTNKAGKILGLQYEAWESMKSQMDTLMSNYETVESELNEIKSLGFWKRLLCLFTGIKINQKNTLR